MNLFFERPEYSRKLFAWRDKPIIKVITGVRRCGKSTLMDMWSASCPPFGR